MIQLLLLDYFRGNYSNLRHCYVPPLGILLSALKKYKFRSEGTGCKRLLGSNWVKRHHCENGV